MLIMCVCCSALRNKETEIIVFTKNIQDSSLPISSSLLIFSYMVWGGELFVPVIHLHCSLITWINVMAKPLLTKILKMGLGGKDV